MATQLEILPYPGVNERFLKQIRSWATQVLARTEGLPVPPYLCINVWKTIDELQDFYQREKEALGIFTGSETAFLATHDAWRGYPRVHICEEKLRKIPDEVIQGVLHHEMSHALHHGALEFYTFRFSNRLQEAGLSCGLDLSLLQHCVYFLSIAIKDLDVVQWLAQIELAFSQIALLEYMICDNKDEQQGWEMARNAPALKKIALAAFLKIVLPMEAMIALGIEEARTLREKWNQAYAWLSKGEREGLSRFVQRTLECKAKTFQERLEYLTLELITDPSL
ncbi:MAG: hypothetical protein PVG99_13725 [Desulfobacteraceae bacterium]|jgi:hypothetical protein